MIDGLVSRRLVRQVYTGGKHNIAAEEGHDSKINVRMVMKVIIRHPVLAVDQLYDSTAAGMHAAQRHLYTALDPHTLQRLNVSTTARPQPGRHTSDSRQQQPEEQDGSPAATTACAPHSCLFNTVVKMIHMEVGCVTNCQAKPSQALPSSSF